MAHKNKSTNSQPLKIKFKHFSKKCPNQKMSTNSKLINLKLMKNKNNNNNKKQLKRVA